MKELIKTLAIAFGGYYVGKKTTEIAVAFALSNPQKVNSVDQMIEESYKKNPDYYSELFLSIMEKDTTETMKKYAEETIVKTPF